MATVKRHEELVTYLIETDSLGDFPNSNGEPIVSLIERSNEGIIFTEVNYYDNEEKPDGYYQVYVSINKSKSTTQQRNILRKVLELLRKHKMILSFPENDLKSL